LVEHHFTGFDQVSSTLTLLACLAMRTTTLRLGSGVLTLPWHNPVLVAEQAATVDLMSGGRLDLGIGKGYRHTEFVGFGISPHEAQQRFDEGVEVMTRSWTSAVRFSHTGTYWQFGDIVVEPKPGQSPHPPLWIAAGSDSSVMRAAAAGYNLILDQYASPVQIRDRIGIYREELARQLFDSMNIAVARNVYVADTEAEAEAARRGLAVGTQRILDVARDPKNPTSGSHVLAYQDPGAADAYALYGTPDQVAQGLAELQEAGVTYVLVVFRTDVSQLRRFRHEVIPRLRA
jgi:alkanesulfonate monooxygenase SsuD/methylene tetrahydromethanopterin reductase-like flavin-dependent oxidoreductase (luciferase family)